MEGAELVVELLSQTEVSFIKLTWLNSPVRVSTEPTIAVHLSVDLSQKISHGAALVACTPEPRNPLGQLALPLLSGVAKDLL